MTGFITSCKQTETKHTGIIIAEDGLQYRFEEPLYHLDDTLRQIGLGARVTFLASRHHQHEGVAFDVRLG